MANPARRVQPASPSPAEPIAVQPGSRGRGSRHALSRGRVLDVPAQTGDALAVLEAGLLCVYVTAADGRKFVLDFLFPGAAAIPLESVVAGTGSGVHLEALDDCIVTVWRRDLPGASGAPSRSALLERRQIEQALVRKSQRFLWLLTRNAAERYAGLDEEFPPAWRSIPQHLLASYLGVTPQYLCRLKRG